MMNRQFKKGILTPVILTGMFVSGVGIAHATDLGMVSAGTHGAGSKSILSAPYQAPSQGSLRANQPQSTISQHFIQNNIPAAGNYNDIAKIAPSVWSVSPNGMGGSDQGGLTLRGFQDGQFNVTFDGIPFADGDDFTHHVNDYFMAQDTGSEKITRGPGSANTVGSATYGGTIAMKSKDPTADVAAIRPYVSYGSFNSQLYGLEYDTGVMQNLNDASAIINYKHYTSNGYLTYEPTRRDNVFAKYIQPLSGNSVATFVLMLNQTSQHASPGATAQEMSSFGMNYGLSNNPNSQSYTGYNWDHFKTAFTYVDLQTQQGHLKLDNKIYGSVYNHLGLAGYNPNGQTTANLTGNAFLTNYVANGGAATDFTGLTPNGVPGNYSLTFYRTVGDVLAATYSIGMSDVKFGVWFDHQTHKAWQHNADVRSGNYNMALSNAYASTDTTIQPYAEVVWRPTDNLTITPGVKFNSFNRTMNPLSTDMGTVSTNKSWSNVLPSLTAHYYLSHNWSIYAQAAKGFLAPQISTLQPQATATVVGQPKANITQNYQLGTTWKTRKLTLSTDIYYIHESNVSNPVTNAAGTKTYWSNVGGARYRGIEGEGTYYVGKGFSLYGNASYMSISSASPVQNAPKNTAAAGVIYNLWPVYASVMAKEVGQRYSGTDVNGNNIRLGAYSVVNTSLSYRFGHQGGKHTTVRLKVNNLLNYRGRVMSLGNTANAGYALYFNNPGRNMMLSASKQF